MNFEKVKSKILLALFLVTYALNEHSALTLPLIIFSLLFMSDRMARPSSLILYLLWMTYFCNSPELISSESALIGWLLLLNVARHSELQKRMAWILLIFVYFHSGLSKIQDEGWISGYTIETVGGSALMRFPKLISSHTLSNIAPGLSMTIIFSQLIAPVCFLGIHLRRLFWWIQVAFHITSLILLRVDQVNLAFLAFHFFLYEKHFLSVFTGPVFVKKRKM